MCKWCKSVATHLIIAWVYDSNSMFALAKRFDKRWALWFLHVSFIPSHLSFVWTQLNTTQRTNVHINTHICAWTTTRRNYSHGNISISINIELDKRLLNGININDYRMNETCFRIVLSHKFTVLVCICLSLYLSSLFDLPVLQLIGFSHIVFVERCHVHQFTNSPKKIWYTNIDNRKQIAFQSHKLINSFNAMCVMAIYLMPILLYHYIKHSTLPINFIWLIFVESNRLWSDELKLIFTTIPCLGYRNVFIINIYHS